MATNSSSPERTQKVIFVYDLPYLERKKLCSILNENDKWKELGGRFMGYSYMDLVDIERGNPKSPTDELLTAWGQKNHTVAELFVLLSNMQHYRAMKELKPFVQERYHVLIHEGEHNVSQVFKAKRNVQQPVSAAEGTPSGQLAAMETRALEAAGYTRSTRSPGDKVDIDPCNLNVEEPPTSLRPKDVHLPEVNGAALPEEKIVNTANIPPMTTMAAASMSPPRWNLSPVDTPRGPSNEIQTPFADPNSKRSIRKNSAASDISSVADNCGSIPQIIYEELFHATNGWDRANVLGKGGFGTVFKGLWKHTEVAIKKMEQKSGASEADQQAQLQQSLGEMRFLNSYRHDNILPLYGYSLGGDAPCLVYQYMPHGSLEYRLLCRHKTPPLNWLQRLHIASGTARGIQFLHTIGDKPLIHGDIKSANILLDKNFEPKIGDFGLAREGPQSHYTHMKVSRVHGTRPYLPDEYLRSKKISTKVDTFSFGIVLFEISTGQRAYEDSREKKFLRDLVEDCNPSQLETLMDPKGGMDNNGIFCTLIQVGCLCIRKLPKERPEMVQVLNDLEHISNTVVTTRKISSVGSTQRQTSMSPTTTGSPAWPQRKNSPTSPMAIGTYYSMERGGSSAQQPPIFPGPFTHLASPEIRVQGPTSSGLSTATTYLSPSAEEVPLPGRASPNALYFQPSSPSPPLKNGDMNMHPPPFACFPPPQQAFVVPPSPSHHFSMYANQQFHLPSAHQANNPCFPAPNSFRLVRNAPYSPQIEGASPPIPLVVHNYPLQSTMESVESSQVSAEGIVPLITALGVKDDSEKDVDAFAASDAGIHSSGSSTSSGSSHGSKLGREQGRMKNTARGKSLSLFQNS